MTHALPPARHFARSLGLLAALLGCVFAPAQRPADPQAYAEMLENFLLKNPAAAETDAPALLETLAARLENPLDINRASRDDLAALGLLSGLQIENFLAYCARLGPLLDVLELQAVPGWEMADLRRVLPLLCVGPPTARQAAERLSDGIFRGENECLLRWGKLPQLPDAQQFEGSDDWLGLRLRHASTDGRVQYGLVAEKDPGEAFFRGSNRRGFDSFGGHFFLQNPGGGRRLRALALGDFSARFGQGLLLQTSFAPGKTAETLNIARGGARLKPYSAFGEIFFFRGFGAVVGFGKRWEATVFGSRLRRDATLVPTRSVDDGEAASADFSSLQTTGLHRTPSEIAGEKSVREQVGGLSLAWSARGARVSANLLHLHYNQPFQPSGEARRQFQFSGKNLLAGSLDYAFHQRNLLFFGETAVSENGRAAVLNGLVAGADRRVAVALLHRYFDRAYQSVYAAPFAETGDAANEHGLYVGLEMRPLRRWQLNGYADLWRHRWLRFSANAPSAGSEFLGLLRFAPNKSTAFWLRFKTETKMQNAPVGAGMPALQTERRDRLRLQAECRLSPSMELHSRVEWSFFRVENQGLRRGFLMFQDLSFKHRGWPLSASGRFVLFDTDDYETRIYTFERDLFSALSVPSFAGRGSRLYLNLTWRAHKRLVLEGRFGQTVFEKMTSGAVAPSRKMEWKMQARLRF